MDKNYSFTHYNKVENDDWHIKGLGAKALKIASYHLWTFPNQCWVSKINIAYSVRCSGQLGVEEKEIEMEITREIFSQEIFQVRTEGRVLQIYIQNERLSVERRII